MVFLIDYLPVIFLGILAVVAPLAAGATSPRAVLVVEIIALAALVVAVFRALCRGQLTALRTLAPVAALVVLLIVFLQMWPLPPGVREGLGGDGYAAYHTASGKAALSLNRFLTRAELVKLLAMFGVFITFVLAVRGAKSVGLLLGLVIATAWSGSNHTESLQELDDSDIGAVACRAFEQSSQATSLLERGDLERLILAGSSGNMIILTAGADALCVVLLKSEAKLGLASNEARRISQAMVGLLEP